jgi:hypothetical protein
VEDFLHKVFLLSTILNTSAKDPDIRIESDEIRLTFRLSFLEHLARDLEDLLGIIFAVVSKGTCVLWKKEQA